MYSTDDDVTQPYLTFPDQAVEDYTEREYKKTLRFIATQWNVRQLNFVYNPVLAPSNNGGLGNDQLKGFAYKYVQNVQYIYGTQAISSYGFFIKDAQGNAIQTPMFRGMDITKYYNIIDGDLRDMIEPLPKMVNVSAYSENALSKRMITLDAIKAKAENLAFFNMVQDLSGVQFNPITEDFANDYQIQRKVENFQEAWEVVYQNLAKNAIYSNHFLKDLVKGGNYIFIGGMGMMEVYEHNGKIIWDLIPPHQAIFDSSKDDDQHETDDYAGRLYESSVTDLLSRWDWTEEEVKDLKAMASTQKSWALYNTFGNINGLNWWQMYNGVPKVAWVKGQWRSLIKQDGEWIEVLREGYLIGNKYVKEVKISDTQVWNKHDKGRKRLKFRIVTPNTLMGSVVGIVDMVKRFQDLKDALTTKMLDLVASSIGKSYFINANKLPEGMKTPELLSQLKQSKVVILEGADIDEEPADKLQALINPIDLSLDPGIKDLLALVQYYDSVIADILNIPPAARGINPTYQPKDVVSSSIAQSNKGMKWFYGNIMLWIQGILEYSADLAKIVLPKSQEGRENLSLIVGDAMVELLSMDALREMQFEDFLLTLNPADIVSEEDKKQMVALGLELAKVGQFTPLDWIKLKKFGSSSEMENYFEFKEMKQQQREQMQRMQELEAAAANADKQVQVQDQMSERQSQTALQNTALKEQGAIIRQDMKDDSTQSSQA